MVRRPFPRRWPGLGCHLALTRPAVASRQITRLRSSMLHGGRYGRSDHHKGRRHMGISRRAPGRPGNLASYAGPRVTRRGLCKNRQGGAAWLLLWRMSARARERPCVGAIAVVCDRDPSAVGTQTPDHAQTACLRCDSAWTCSYSCRCRANIRPLVSGSPGALRRQSMIQARTRLRADKDFSGACIGVHPRSSAVKSVRSPPRLPPSAY